MIYNGIETIKLAGVAKPPNQNDLVAEIKLEKNRRWSASIVAGLLFKEEVPGSFDSANEALDASCRFVTRTGRDKLYYRMGGAMARVIKRTRYVRG